MFEDLMNDLAKAQLQRPHITCHSDLGLLTISNLRENKAQTTLNIDIVLIDGEPNEGGYYAFWNRAKDDDGNMLFTEPCIFKRGTPKERFGIIYKDAVAHLFQVQQAAYKERQAARVEREAEEAEEADARPEGDTDYATELPAVSENEPPF